MDMVIDCAIGGWPAWMVCGKEPAGWYMDDVMSCKILQSRFRFCWLYWTWNHFPWSSEICGLYVISTFVGALVVGMLEDSISCPFYMTILTSLMAFWCCIICWCRLCSTWRLWWSAIVLSDRSVSCPCTDMDTSGWLWSGGWITWPG